MFYDEVVRFLVDNFGEEFKFEDPRISDEYIDKNNFRGEFEIVLDESGDPGDGFPCIAIWKNEEHEMKPVNEKRKLFNEGPGAAYTVTIKNVKLGEVRVEKNGDGDWEFEADIVPDTYKIEASDYYNLFCPMDYDLGGEEWAEVKGKVKGVCWWYDEDYEVERQIRGVKQDISFMYGHGWIHADLPKDGHIVSDHMECDGHDTWEIQSIELNSPELAECVNYCHEHFLDEDEPEEDEDGEQVNEVSGWKLEDDDLTLVNSESDGDKLFIVKLWWGSGYMMDCYNAYAFSAEEALNYVVAYIEKNDPDILKMTDDSANDYLEELVRDGDAEDTQDAEENPSFQEMFTYVDATTEGAQKPHYIWAENLQIAEYPAKHNHPLAKGVDKSKFTESVQDVFTLEVNYIDEEGEPQMIEAMKYAKTYYSYEGALNAAKEAYQEYSKTCEEPVEVWIMGGEYETPEGDIYGDPDVIEVVSADTIASL